MKISGWLLGGFLVVQGVPPPAVLDAMIMRADPSLAPGQGIDIQCSGRDSWVHSFSIMGYEPIPTWFVMSTTNCDLPPGYGPSL